MRINKKELAIGVSKFIWLLPELESDIPLISALFAKTLLDFIDLDFVDFSDLVWIDNVCSKEELEFLSVDINYKIIAHYLKYD